MKSRYQNSARRGFTLIEAAIAAIILSSFALTLMFLYKRSTETFKITLWKQERTAQAEIFWSFMRKHLEEATNHLDLDSQSGDSNPTVPEEPRPIKIHPTPGSAPDGNILAWNVSTTKFDFSPPFAHTSEHNIFSLAKAGKRLELRSSSSPRPLAKIEDIEDISFTVSSIIKNTANEESIEAGFSADAIGTLLEISLTLSPPEGYIAAELKIPYNHKFRVNVSPHSDTAPTY